MKRAGPGPGEIRRIDDAWIGLGRAMTLRVEGRLGSARASEELEMCLRRVHARAMEASNDSIVVDVTRLTWASEGAVRLLATWAMLVAAEPFARRYVLTFRIDGDSSWQRATFEALQSVAPEVVEVVAYARRQR